jgi:hypothetical protein
MYLAEEDEFISKDAQAQIKAALADVPGAKIFSYPRLRASQRSPLQRTGGRIGKRSN